MFFQRFVKIFVVSINLFVFFICALILISNKQEPQEIGKEIRFKVDSSFSKEQKVLIGEAIEEWGRVARGCFIVSSYEDDVSIKEVSSWKEDRTPTIYNAQSFLSWKYYIAKYSCNSNCIGIAFPAMGDIFIIDPPEHLFKSTILHEVGHILKLKHSFNMYSLMYPTIAHIKIIGAEEVNQLKCHFGVLSN